jgi:4-carboxymuconolactone decarboxylase
MADSGFEDNEKFLAGLALRRQVLGEEHVERSMAAALEDPFLRPIQQMAVEFGWGQVWNRPGLPLKVRSFLSVAFLAALGKHAELRSHIRGALNNGATPEELTEVLLQAAVYCGMPVGLECFRIAKEVLDERGANKGQ